MTNNQTDKRSTTTPLKIFLFLVLLALAVYFAVQSKTEQHLSKVQLETKQLIYDQETHLAAIAESTARNAGDEITERIVRDCTTSERARFDRLLGSLDSGLPQSELVELERLFGRCGNFFAARKSVMVARLEREVEVYETLVTVLNHVTSVDNTEEYQTAAWNELVTFEVKQSELFTQLVAVQDQIIALLIEGEAPTSDAVTAALQEASQIQGSLVVANQQAAKLRSSLVSK